MKQSLVVADADLMPASLAGHSENAASARRSC
jgi:hypothetical protein